MFCFFYIVKLKNYLICSIINYVNYRIGDKKLIKTISIIKQNQENISTVFQDGVKTDMLFRELQKDTVGRSGSSPTWGYVYFNQEGKLKFTGIALHKEYDYDFPYAAYGEKTWSIFGKELLGDTVRVPDIDIVEEKKGYPEIISYRLMNNDREDMIHIKDTLFNKFERDEIRAKKDIFTIDEILECVKLQIENDENYKKIERDIIRVLLLDSITNNGDRHALNWALVRDEKTGEYSLAVFDHASAFVDMFERSYILGNGWSTSYVTVGNDRGRHTIGSDGKVVVEYISQEYPEYFEEFCNNFEAKLPNIMELVRQEEMKIDFRRLSDKIGEKKRFLRRLRNKGEIEYE